MLFDFATQKWTKAFGSEMGYENWSHDGKYLYFQNYAARDVLYRIVRLRLGVRPPERLQPGLDLRPMTLRCSLEISAPRKSIRSKCTGRSSSALPVDQYSSLGTYLIVKGC